MFRPVMRQGKRFTSPAMGIVAGRALSVPLSLAVHSGVHVAAKAGTMIRLVIVETNGNKIIRDQKNMTGAIIRAREVMTRSARGVREVQVTSGGKVMHAWRAYTRWQEIRGKTEGTFSTNTVVVE
jgi:hypothetical protein